MMEVLGIVMLVQGVGGFINLVAGSDNESWFLQLHVLPGGLHIPASVLLALIGAVLTFAGTAKRGSRAR